jgi:hypothetical protein
MPGYNQGGKFDDIISKVLINKNRHHQTAKNEVLLRLLT